MKTSPWFALALGAVFVFGEIVLASALFRLQVLNTADFREDQAVQTKRRVRTPGMRGRILDCKGRVLADCRPSHGIRCNLEEFQRRGAASNTAAAVDLAVDRLSRAIDLPRQITSAQIARHLRTASAVSLVAWQDLDDRSFARFCEHANEFPGFEDFTEVERVYPNGSLAAHVLGYTGRGELEGFEDDPVYFSGKEIKGREGVERFHNGFLTGVPGEATVWVDARGFQLTRERKDLIEDDRDGDIPPSPGLDLTLTLDLDLQRAREDALQDVTGAGVVLDPQSGAVLAMASAPTFNPNDCIPRLSSAVYASLTNAPMKRGQNRAVSEAYAPGSTFKPITALAALKYGWLPDDEYDCRGVYRLGNLRLHCWDRFGHGPIAVRQALEQSCNTFFCNLGSAVGTNAVLEAARAFGLGAPTGIDIGGETPGVLPDDAWKRRAYNEPWYPGDTCQMSIGQGMLLVTPLQMAVVAATLANGGRVYRPFLHARPEGDGPVKPVGTLPFPAADIELVRLGMKDVADKGTGRRILLRQEPPAPGTYRRRSFRLNVDGAGKTGTAEIGRGETKRKNTWVIAFAPYENPTVALAIIVERGESGGSTVAPRVHSVLASIFGETETTSARGGSNLLEGRD
ncbi:MAG: penicillin-binding protein 2 [Kiritimatiellae bacterium]|nr:penicillin-binding protein 2 [Kiritimatiellia bacterium]